ncbi:YaaL family protein [Vallitalea guaymasensis]|uniref:YaaL family protein n=2 Tax=Vallitalea guaymasensis TaxID=1185412 RepID=A0A8J8MB66_9FIRM|nr:YaaL family protein [Vallitalea guaymasensis]QUH29490.1 YaaL family protein [Vallitalea guaymasensis]
MSFINNVNLAMQNENASELNEEEVLLKNIEITKRALDTAYSNFDVVTDPELIDSCIYEVKAMQLKYEYLINQAKQMNIIAKIR